MKHELGGRIKQAMPFTKSKQEPVNKGIDVDATTIEPQRDGVFEHSPAPRSFERSEEVLQQLKRAFPEMTVAELMEMMDAPNSDREEIDDHGD